MNWQTVVALGIVALAAAGRGPLALGDPPPAPALKVVREVVLSGDLLSVARLPRSEKLFVGGATGKIHLLDLSAEKPTPESWDAHVSYVSALALTDKHLISAGSDHQLIWWDAESRSKVRAVEAHPKWIRAIALSPDGKILATVGDDMVCRLWESGTGKLIRELKGHDLVSSQGLVSKLYSCAFTPDGKFVATGDQIGQMIVWKSETGEQVAKIDAPYFYAIGSGHTCGGVRTVAFSPDGTLLAGGGNVWGDTSVIGGSKALVQVFDWKSGMKTHDFQLAKDNFIFERIRFHPQGDWLVGAGGSGGGQKMVLFDLQKKAVVHETGVSTVVYDIVLDEQAGAIYGVGRGKVFKWAVAN